MFLSQVFSLVLSLVGLFNCLHPEGQVTQCGNNQTIKQSNNQTSFKIKEFIHEHYWYGWSCNYCG